MDFIEKRSPEFVVEYRERLRKKLDLEKFTQTFSDEFSRDIEPSRGPLKDHYYYQLCANIRRFKGISEPMKTEGGQTINIQNGEEAVAFELWKNGKRVYFSTRFNFTVPSAIAVDDNVTVKAVQANGERFDVQ